MPHVKVSLEERLEKLARHCADHNTPISLFFDPDSEEWSGALDGTGWMDGGEIDAEVYTGELDHVLESIEAELEI